jgi:hypothetical protein
LININFIDKLIKTSKKDPLQHNFKELEKEFRKRSTDNDKEKNINIKLNINSEVINNNFKIHSPPNTQNNTLLDTIDKILVHIIK